MRRRRTIILWIGLGIATLTTLACADAPTLPTPAATDVVGTYQLAAVNDTLVPLYSERHDSTYSELAGGILELTADGQYHAEVYSVTVHGHMANFRTDYSIGRWEAQRGGVNLIGLSADTPIAASATTVTLFVKSAERRYAYSRRAGSQAP